MAKARRTKRLDEEIERLYSLPLDEFTRERNAAAKRLRDEGEGAAAEEVKKLRKPNLPAWAINRAVRENPDAAEGLIAAGERLDEAQSAVLEGADPSTLREAIAEQHEAVEGVMRAVEGELGRDRSGSMVDRARETLRAIAGDEELRAEFASGRITRDREAVGFGGAPVAVPKRRRGGGTRPSAHPSRGDAAEAARRRKAEQAEKRARHSLDLAVKRVEEARRRLERAERAADEARAEHEEAEREQGEREAELADAKAVLR